MLAVMDIVYGPVDEAKRTSYQAAMVYAFAAPTNHTEKWINRAGHENLRCLSRGDEVLVALMMVPMGLWLGGRSIPNVGISGVGATGESRGAGHARDLMIAMLEELRESKVPISTLYPATIGLYRAVGYELAGSYYTVEAETDSIPRRRTTATIRRATLEDHDAMKSLYRACRQEDGNLDRGPYIWARVFEPQFETADGFVVEEDGVITGYTTFVKQVKSVPFHDFELTDLVASTPASRDRLLDFFRSHRSFVKKIRWYGGAVDPFLAAWPEKSYRIELGMQFMVRIVDPALALEARGYEPHVAERLRIAVRDKSVPANDGVYTMTVEGGAARATRTTTAGELAMSVRGLSALYTGFLPARQLRAMGWIEGDDAAVQTAERIFVSRSPWTCEMF